MYYFKPGDRVTTSGLYLSGITWYKEYTIISIRNNRSYLENNYGEVEDYAEIFFNLSPGCIRDNIINSNLE